MHRIRKALILALLLVTSSAYAQRAVIIQLPNGQMVGIAYTPTGEQIVLTDIKIFKLDPTPPTPVAKGPVWVIVIKPSEAQGHLTPDQTEILLNLRTWTDQQPADKLRHTEFTSDAVSSEGVKDKAVASWVAKIPPGSSVPYVFISQLRADGNGSVIHWHGALAPAADLIRRVKEVVK